MLVPVTMVNFAVQLERGTLDRALIMPDTAAKMLSSRWLFDERYVFVLRAGHLTSRVRST